MKHCECGPIEAAVQCPECGDEWDVIPKSEILAELERRKPVLRVFGDKRAIEQAAEHNLIANLIVWVRTYGEGGE